MDIKLDNEDFLLGAIAAQASNELQVEWVASGSYESMAITWYLISFDGQSTMVSYDSEGGSLSYTETFKKVGKRDITLRLIDKIRHQTFDTGDTTVAIILSAEGASVSPRLVAKRPLLQCVQKGFAQLGLVLNPSAWAKQVGFK